MKIDENRRKSTKTNKIARKRAKSSKIARKRTKSQISRFLHAKSGFSQDCGVVGEPVGNHGLSILFSQQRMAMFILFSQKSMNMFILFWSKTGGGNRGFPPPFSSKRYEPFYTIFPPKTHKIP